MAKKATKYTATDGELFLELKVVRPRRDTVSSPFIPGWSAPAKSLPEAFQLAQAATTAKVQEGAGENVPVKKTRSTKSKR
ncbi:type II toxin-antitoxin system HicB family antitoxin [Gemmata sp.]|uniref:type II toxin-antitoxin system HicB family antitoxin n=1 Tax=Gemmata sp. TaxID=1914242 RepID=UPI003F71E59B